jgi:hypothetical protein
MADLFYAVVWFFIAGRAALGVAPFVAAGPLVRLFKLPPEEDTATARVFARFFGVRDIGLGIVVAAALSDMSWLRWSFLFNALMDAGDFCAVLLGIRARPQLKRQFLAFGAFSVAGGLGWVVLYFWSGALS